MAVRAENIALLDLVEDCLLPTCAGSGDVELFESRIAVVKMKNDRIVLATLAAPAFGFHRTLQLNVAPDSPCV